MSDISTSFKGKVLVGMSGGVDSCVAAMLLKQQGWQVSGATMDIGSAGSSKDISDAAKAAENIGIQHIVIDLKERFKDSVIDYFISEYACGRTPNPCVECNRTIKMGAMIDIAAELGFDHFSTGHYARVVVSKKTGLFELHKGVSEHKDQSYVLYNLTQNRLAHLVFPLGDMTKEEVKKLAAINGLVDPLRGESQDICFIPDGDYASYINKSNDLGFQSGDFIDISGSKLGRHNGTARYTIGQRKGIGISAGIPLFVISKDPVRNAVTLGPEEELFAAGVTASKVNLIDPDEIVTAKSIQVKIRYASRPADAVITSIADKTAKIVFDKPQRAVAPGQSVVFYDGTRVVGGGVID